LTEYLDVNLHKKNTPSVPSSRSQALNNSINKSATN